MKRYKYILLAILMVSVSACRKINIPPPNIISDETVFSSAAGIQAYMSRIYTIHCQLKISGTHLQGV